MAGHRALAAGAAAAALVFGALGVWQIERRAWKLDLVARVEARVHAPAAPIPSPGQWPSVSAALDEYRHVVATGVFDPRATLTQAVTDYGGGFWALTPLRLAGGGTVLVNRGFVPSDRRDPATWRSPPAGETTVVGLLRLSEPGGGFLRANQPPDRWFSRDVAAIAAARGLGDAAPFFIDAERAPGEAGYPIAGLTVVAFANNHLVYALTWFSLAAMAAAAAGYILRDASRAALTS